MIFLPRVWLNFNESSMSLRIEKSSYVVDCEFIASLTTRKFELLNSLQLNSDYLAKLSVHDGSVTPQVISLPISML